MMNEIFLKLPEMIQTLLEKISQLQINSESLESRLAREKLISQLKNITEEISHLSKQTGENLTEEQIQKIIQIPRPTSNTIPWITLSKMRDK
jgi:stage III sporulation protein SpoIIIAA